MSEIPNTPVLDPARGAALGLLAAALFGLSAPVAKQLLDSIEPVLLAGLLYAGAAMGLWCQRLLVPRTSEAPLRPQDRRALTLIVICGGALAPVLMLLGLRRLSAVSGSLLLNLEAPFTVLLAVVAFGEHLGRRGLLAVTAIVLGATSLTLVGAISDLGAESTSANSVDPIGVLLVAGACACWGLDNNLTQKISVRDPFAIARIKTTASGAFNVLLGGVLLRGALPEPTHVLGALLLGSVSYGASVVLDAYALRYVGAAREAAYFATAPFVGVLISILVMGEPLHWSHLAAAALMATGVILLLAEKHSHAHEHEAMAHEHMHSHDEHHQHEHAPGESVSEPHSHFHRHDALTHEHHHVPDVHHRHRH